MPDAPNARGPAPRRAVVAHAAATTSTSTAMLPREHGAYGQLAFPLVTALAIGDARPAAALLAGGAVAAFLAHEPLLVATGRRGRRARTTHGARAWRHLSVRALAAVAMGVAGLALAPHAARVGALVAAALAAGFAAVLATDRARTTSGEIVASTALSAAALPVALASGMDARAAITLCVVWAAASGLGNAAVRGVILRARAGGHPRDAFAAAAAGLGACALAVVLARAGLLAPVAPMALLPSAAASVGLAIAPPSPRRLRAVGWTLMATSLATAVVLGVALR